MVVVAQLAERWLVEPDVAGSSPVDHPSVRNEQVEDPSVRTRVFFYSGSMPDTLERTELDESALHDSPWLTVVWNDPVNLMNYVSYVFRSYFGFDREKAERLMMQVHEEGRAVVASGGREQMERHVEAMHDFGLWATVQKDEA